MSDTSLPPSPLTAYGPPAPPQSASEALGPAWENTRRILFQPFQLRKWLKLAFVALLAGVMAGGGGGTGGGGNFGTPSHPSPGGGSGTGSGPKFDEVWQHVLAWYHVHSAAVIGGAVAVGACLLVLGLVMAYISGVFRFIFLESVITNEVHVRDSWRRNRAQGLSFFGWKVAFGFFALVVVGLVVGLPTALFLMSLGWKPSSGAPSGALNAGSVGAILLGVFLLLIVAIVLGLINALVRDFVLPLMYVRRTGVREGWRECWRLLCDNKVGFLVYFLLKILVTIGAGIASLFLGCAGMFVAAIPLAVIAGLGYLIVHAAGIHTWDWSYLWGIVPLGVALLFGLGYWMACVLLPIPVFYQSYALRYLGYVEPSIARALGH